MLNYVLTIHGAVLSAALVALYRYGERSNEVKSLNEQKRQLVKTMRFEIADYLRTCLRPVFERRTTTIDVSGILNDPDDPFEVRIESPEGTQAYKDALLDFVSEKKHALADFCGLRSACAWWGKWSKVRSWTALLTVVWELAALSAVGICNQVAKVTVGDVWLVASLVPTGLLVATFLVAMAACMLYLDHIIQHVDNHE